VRRLWRFHRSGMSHRGCRRSQRGRVERRSSRRTAVAFRNTYRMGELRILVARGEAKEPVIAISPVLDNPVLAGAMGEAGRQRAVERSHGTWYRYACRFGRERASGSQDGKRKTAAQIAASGKWQLPYRAVDRVPTAGDCRGQ